MTVGGEAAQPVYDWHPLAVSAHSVGGNKAQCHGNHIKSTLKLIYLKSNEYHVYIELFLCMFYDPMSIPVVISFWGGKKKQSGENNHIMVY